MDIASFMEIAPQNAKREKFYSLVSYHISKNDEVAEGYETISAIPFLVLRHLTQKAVSTLRHPVMERPSLP